MLKGVIFLNIMDRIALILTIIGGINWGAIGIFARIVYTLVCISAIWCISLLFRNTAVE